MPLSTAAKAALCICPPALMAGTVATVPAAKRAVHHLTAPRQAPKPTRVARTIPSAQPAATAQPSVDCAPVAGVVPPAQPLVTYAAAVPDEPSLTSGSAGTLGPVIGAVGAASVVGPGPVVTPLPDPTTPVPEPSVWLMMIVGVGTLGAALRRRRHKVGTSRGPRKAGDGRRGLAATTAAGGGLWSGSVAVEAGDMAVTVAAKSAVASAAGKAMLCVCPALAVAGSVVGVPPLRQAVHAYTALPQVAAPVVPAVQAAPPCTEPMTIPVSGAALNGFPEAVATVPVPAPATAASSATTTKAPTA